MGRQLSQVWRVQGPAGSDPAVVLRSEDHSKLESRTRLKWGTAPMGPLLRSRDRRAKPPAQRRLQRLLLGHEDVPRYAQYKSSLRSRGNTLGGWFHLLVDQRWRDWLREPTAVCEIPMERTELRSLSHRHRSVQLSAAIPARQSETLPYIPTCTNPLRHTWRGQLCSPSSLAADSWRHYSSRIFKGLRHRRLIFGAQAILGSASHQQTPC
ncbi:hypothetical protein D9M69_154870 [compost metagenome]